MPPPLPLYQRHFTFYLFLKIFSDSFSIFFFPDDRSLIQVPFLNLMANLQERAGRVMIRIGGNTQDIAVLVDQLDNGRAIAKEKTGLTQMVRWISICLSLFKIELTRVVYLFETLTPAVLYTPDLFYIAANISRFVNVDWFIGPFSS